MLQRRVDVSEFVRKRNAVHSDAPAADDDGTTSQHVVHHKCPVFGDISIPATILRWQRYSTTQSVALARTSLAGTKPPQVTRRGIYASRQSVVQSWAVRWLKRPHCRWLGFAPDAVYQRNRVLAPGNDHIPHKVRNHSAIVYTSP